MKTVVLGGGFAGVRCAQELSKNGRSDVALIDRKDYFELPFAQLAALIEPQAIGARSRYPYSSFLSAAFIQGQAETVTEDAVILSDGRRVEYGTLIIATGSSYRAFPIGKPVSETAMGARNAFFVSENARLAAAAGILIVGGGPVGVELAGEIGGRYPEKRIRLVHGTDRLLGYLGPRAGKEALRQLERLGVEVILNERLSRDGDGPYRSALSGDPYPADLTYECLGAYANTAFMKERFPGSLDARGMILVDRGFSVRDAENVYAIGDCAAIDEAKLAIFAEVHGAFLARRLIGAARGSKAPGYAPRKTISIVPIGRRDGVVQPRLGWPIRGMAVRMKTRDFFIGKYRRLHGAD